jgi:hypothetical protein
LYLDSRASAEQSDLSSKSSRDRQPVCRQAALHPPIGKVLGVKSASAVMVASGLAIVRHAE